MSWLGIWLGLSCRRSRWPSRSSSRCSSRSPSCPTCSSRSQTLPTWLQPVAEWNPTSTLTGALRELWGNPNPFATDSFPSQNPVLVTLVWVVVIVAIFAPLGVRRYRSMSR